MTDFIFAFDSITVKGKTFPAGYSVTPSGAVVVFVEQANSAEKIRVRFNPDHPDYTAALAAAKGERPAAIPETVEIVPEAPTVPVELLVEAPAAARVEAEEKPRQIPEKPFIGDSIQGKGWRIYFDGNTARTRVMFEAAPTDAARAAVEKAGFYFSGAMNSWNKKLTFKAYRAAQALSCELSALYV